jgi:formylglycine-generating enzyme required for sulfatase activity
MDQQDAGTALQVRWDWESDGTWDTPLDSVKTATHRFEAPGTKTISMQVQDTGGALGLLQETVEVTAGGPPLCQVTPTQLSFGTVTVGQERSMGFMIKNAGGGILRGSVSESCPAYSILSAARDYALAAGQEKQIAVRFSPTEAGVSGCLIDLGSAACQVTCIGTGTDLPPLPPDLVLIAAGTFIMGSPGDEPGRWPHETLHQVTLTKAFYVCDHEVTQSEWQAVMGWNGSSYDGPNRPVEQVTWFDCIQYCNRRSTREGLDSVYVMTDRLYSGVHIVGATVTLPSWSERGYRLPTEAEWEYACRAGSTTAFCNGSINSSGWDCDNDAVLDAVGWYCGDSNNITHAVKARSPNALGLYDIHGNVWEWCWDAWDGSDYDEASVTDPTGAPQDSYRVARGGGWNSHAAGCRSAMRGRIKSVERYHTLGLRLSVTAP